MSSSKSSQIKPSAAKKSAADSASREAPPSRTAPTTGAAPLHAASASTVRRPRRVFTDEFKQAAVRLVVSEGYTFAAAARAVDVGEQTLRNWHAKLAPQPEPCGADASLEELRAENLRLRRELKRAELEREILKKATAYFAKESL
jgi:transposase